MRGYGVFSCRLLSVQTITNNHNEDGCLRLAAVALAFLTVPTFAAAAQDPLKFSDLPQTPFQEGYLTLNWNEIPEAAEYELFNSEGLVLYRGLFPEAFVSGLRDGSYQFHVRALDRDGNLLAQTESAATVNVKHWSLPFALSLLACGAVVFVVLIALIVVGTSANATERVE